MNTYFGYTRVSTVKQGEGVSLQEQKHAIERFAETNNLTISTWFEERETAAKQGRPKFTEMVRLLRQGQAKGVVIHKIDRSARNLRDWADLGDLLDQGIIVHFAGDSLDLHSRGGRLSADIQAVVAADYIRNLREETKKGIYGRLKQGLFPMRAPIGYLDQGGGNPKIPDPQKAPLIRKAFELYASQQYTLESLVEEIHKLGLRNWKSGKVSRNGLSIILNNPFYLGLIRLKKTGETFPGIHQPIISKNLFDRVQDILNKKTNIRVKRHDFTYRRLITCKKCGYSLIGESRKGYVYYRCHKPECRGTSIRESFLEEQIGFVLKRLQFNPHEAKRFENDIRLLRKEWGEKKEKLEKSMILSLDQIKDRLNRLTDAYIDRMIDKDIFESRKENLLMEQVEIQDRLRKIQTQQEQILDQVQKFVGLAKNLYPSYFFGEVEEKRDLLKLIMSDRLLEGKKLDFILRKPFDMLQNRQSFTLRVPQRDTGWTLPSFIHELIVFLSSNPDISLLKETNLR